VSSSSVRTVALLGSTGSIGTQAVDVISRHRDRYRVTALSAGGAQPDVLAQQAVDLDVEVVAVSDPAAVAPLREHLARLQPDGSRTVEILSGPDAASTLAAGGADVVLNGITGSVGLGPTLAALRSGSTLALANKESLVVGGPLVQAARVRPDQIVPVDSEHSAMAQSLRSGSRSEVRRLVLTASGGPFRGWRRDDVKAVSVEQALAHPTWSMGPVVTINSATLVNKGLELIEAHLLFDVPVEDITVVVHPQSVVHSMVEFHDGSTIAQASPPDMRLPIALGLSWPERLDDVSVPCDWSSPVSWTFEPLDETLFGAVRLARQVAAAGATHPAVFNAANEECVAAFLAGRIGFLEIVETVERVVGEHEATSGTLTLADVLAAEAWARGRAREVLAER
jgi:1-deoxy-D-xylulose-5-phosphate reductoisomerase